MEIYLATFQAPESVYKGVCDMIQHYFPESMELSLASICSAISHIAGVHPIKDDMCINSCHAFTGPFQDLDRCNKCEENRYTITHQGKKLARKQMTTIPLGPQLAALRCSSGSAQAMRYRHNCTMQILKDLEAFDPDTEEFVYDDIYCQEDYLDLFQHENMTEDNTLVSFSLDRAQLYRNQASDTWIGIWIVQDHSPKK